MVFDDILIHFVILKHVLSQSCKNVVDQELTLPAISSPSPCISSSKKNMEPVVEEKELEIEAVARKMFYGGCCLLPWLWLVNIIYFRKLYFSNDCPLGVKKYVKKSSIGFVTVTTLWIIWCIIFQTNYKSFSSLLVVPVDDGSW